MQLLLSWLLPLILASVRGEATDDYLNLMQARISSLEAQVFHLEEENRQLRLNQELHEHYLKTTAGLHEKVDEIIVKERKRQVCNCHVLTTHKLHQYAARRFMFSFFIRVLHHYHTAQNTS
jgi:hypothetical protein